MALLNYATRVPAERTMAELQVILAKAGAREVLAQWDENGKPAGLGFAVDTSYGRRTFVLPVNTEKVHHVLLRQKVGARYETSEHASWVAWRILKDWVEAQVAIVQTEMVTLDQVMLPYMRADSEGRTVYELVVGHALGLPAGS
jgi:hypothetical protein